MASVVSLQGEAKAPVYKVNYTFKLHDFPNIIALSEPGMHYDSAIFGHLETPEVTWRVAVFPRGDEGSDGSRLEVFLYPLSPITLPFDELTFRHGQKTWGPFGGTFDQFESILLKHGEVEYSEPGVFEVSVGVEYVWGEAKVLDGPSGPQPTKALDHLAILFSQDFSDFALVVEGLTIPVHKAILASASPVFRRMFVQTATAEAQSRTAVLENTYVGAVRLLLRFAYTGRLDEAAADGAGSKESAEASSGDKSGGDESAGTERTWSLCGALGLAGRYDVAGLGEAAEAELLGLIRQHSFLHIAAAAHLHGFHNLLRACREALTSGRVELKDWEALAEAQPKLIPNLFLVPIPQIHKA